MKKRFYHGLRFKLLLVSLTLLAIPVMGYRFVIEMETFLRDTQQQHLHNSALSLAQTIAQSSLITSTKNTNRLYVHPLKVSPTLDGYADDWQALKHNATTFIHGSLSFSLLMGDAHETLYLLAEVADLNPVYSQQTISQGTADQIIIKFDNSYGVPQHYLISPRAPGWVTAYPMYQTSEGLRAGPQDQRIHGEWQETSSGYNLELAIPLSMLNQQFELQVQDYQSEHNNLTSSASSELIYPILALKKLLHNRNAQGQRLRVLDDKGYVLALDGDLQRADIKPVTGMLAVILNMILRHQAGEQQEISADQTYIPNHKNTASSYQTLDANTVIIANRAPIILNDKVLGSVLVEETTDAILSIQNHAMQRLVHSFLILFTLIALLLLGYASLLTGRIRKLHRQVAHAVTAEGRIISQIKASNAMDEIGDLGRNVATTLERLQEYNQYLEAMASRLAHELRTPLTIVKTSLENCCQVTQADEKEAYLQRAIKGSERLDLILQQLQEATRLEKTIQQAEVMEFDLCELMTFNLQNFQQIHPQLKFSFSSCSGVMIKAAPDLISQALEKVMANAVDFHTPGSTIKCSIETTADSAWLYITNQGIALPENTNLFQSMISIRKKSTEAPHLGLGLYLVKLIAEFHQGKTKAINLQGSQGVTIGFSLPLSN